MAQTGAVRLGGPASFARNAFTLLRLAETFLDEHVPVASTFTPGQMRPNDRPLYPPLAVREALVNALVHRDYSITGGAISVAVFDDRLEVWSAGRLPAGLTPEMLKGRHDSVRRNPLIASTFHRRGLIEQWGRGTNKIVDEAAKAGCPEPEFEEVTGSFVVRFHPATATPAAMPVPGVSPRGERVLRILKEAGALGAAEVLDRLGEDVTLRAVQKELRQLRGAGKIRARGAGKATVYETR